MDELSASMEDYVKILYILKRRYGHVYSIDVACETGYSKASVSQAMMNLRKKKIVVMKEDGEIVFTKKGSRIAGELYEKYTILCSFLQSVAGVDEKTARKDACRMEHCLSDSTYSGIKTYVDHVFLPKG